MADKYTIFNENPDTINPLFVQAPPSRPFVNLHNSGGTYVPGICTDSDSGFSPRTSVYQEQINDPAGCYRFENFTDPGINAINYTNNGSCSPYWIRKINSNFETVDGKSTVTSRQMHWLNGGYFYGMEEYRKYIYNELGTIHFSTNVKYNIESFYDDSPNLRFDINYIPEFYVNSPREEFKILATDPTLPITYYHSPSMFDIGSAFMSINNYHDLEQRTVNSLLPIINYNPVTKKYESAFKETEMNINNCGYFIVSSEKPTNITEPDNICVMLSNGNISYYPLTNEKIQTKFHHRKSFSIGESQGIASLSFDFITPTTNVYDESDNYIGSVNNQIFNSYFINNAFKTSYNITTTSVSLAKSDSEYFNNFKFIVTLTGSGKLVLLRNQQIKYANQYNDIVVYQEGNLLHDIIQYMKTRYSNINLLFSLYEYTTDGTTIQIDTNNNVLGDGVSIITGSTLFDGSVELEFDDETYLKLIDISSLGSSKEFAIMIKASTFLTGYNNTTIEKNVAGSINSLGVKKRATTDEYRFDINKTPDILNQTSLFNTNASRFSTPDYSAFETNYQFIEPIKIPFRGSEYSETNIKDHPVIRYIRKPNGKFYIQILAGAFPYYHSVVHNPVTQHLTPTDQETPTEYSLRQICKKNPEWYKHVSTTKWTCHIKHTEFGSDSSDYVNTVIEKSDIVPTQSSVVGGRPPGSKPKNPGSSSPYVYGGNTPLTPPPTSGLIIVPDDRNDSVEER